jgi:putative membrane protein
MKHALLCSLAAVALSATPAFAAAQSQTPPSKIQPKQEFIKVAAQDDMAEASLGNLVKEKAADAAVTQLAERLVRDHTSNLTEVKQLAAKENVELPIKLSEEQQALERRLKSLSGNQLEQEYLKAMVQGHKEAIAAFEVAANQTQDSNVQMYAQKTLPILQQHLKMAQDAQHTIVGTSGRK